LVNKKQKIIHKKTEKSRKPGKLFRICRKNSGFFPKKQKKRVSADAHKKVLIKKIWASV